MRDKMKKKLIILSLWPLFALTFIENFPWSKIDTVLLNLLNFDMIIKHLCLFIGILICLIWSIASMVIYIQFKYFFKYDKAGGYTITCINEEKEAGLNFFLALILPLMTNDIDKINNLLSYLILVIIIILLISKTDLFYQNPVLTITGYRIYKFKFDDNINYGTEECIGISFNEIDGTNTIEYKNIQSRIFVIKQMEGRNDKR
jgi:hypothetical protein